MTSAERVQRIQEVERAAAQLVEEGWCVDRLVYVDEPDEPFRAIVRLRCDGESEARGTL